MILLLNGPNLGMLGTREVDVYGTTTLPDIEREVRAAAAAQQVRVDTLQTNHEGVAIDRLEQRDFDGLIINPGAWTHYSYALRDALASVPVSIVEIHISAVDEREDFRRNNVIRDVVSHTISGQGWQGYLQALEWLLAQGVR
ncbi:MAG: type II 3-dehydroquinate dehydratase [Bowdeniella nasicola]|nr:type II 3-dehydroquinate dehydratase [Bowdeniella nasicola]